MKKNKKLKIKWLAFAISGILLMGFGLSMLGHSIISKQNNEEFIYWFLWGTLSLILVFSGLSLFGEAIVFRIKYLKKGKN
jgi:uncharacterized membrane protein YjfL (UPF0719 family)